MESPGKTFVLKNSIEMPIQNQTQIKLKWFLWILNKLASLFQSY